MEPPKDLFQRVQGRLPSRRRLWLIRHRAPLLAAAAVIVLAGVGLVARPLLEGPVRPVTVDYTQGELEVRRGAGSDWRPLRGGGELAPGTEVRAAAGQPARLDFQDWTQLVLRGGSELTVQGEHGRVAHWWRLRKGELWAEFGPGRFQVDTAAGSVAGEACELMVRVTGRPLAHGGGFWPAAFGADAEDIPRTTVLVARGVARAWTRHGTVEVRTGMETRLEAGRPPMTPRAANLAVALAWKEPSVAEAVPSPEVEAVEPPPPPPPFQEATTEEPARVLPRIPVSPPEPPPIAVPDAEGPPPGPPVSVRATSLVGGSIEVTWNPPRQGAAPVAYKVWRKAQGEDNYKQLTVPPLAAGEPGERVSYPDHEIGHGMIYTYRVSAVDELGREGPLGQPVDETAQDFELSYRGGSQDVAVIYVKRRVGQSWVTHPFRVHKRDRAAGESGVVGGRVRKSLGLGPQTVDLRTGYVLVDIVTRTHPVTGETSRQVILEDAEGKRQSVWQAITRSNGS
jgi:hypothetical protein